jgi:hypothetical protein
MNRRCTAQLALIGAKRGAFKEVSIRSFRQIEIAGFIQFFQIVTLASGISSGYLLPCLLSSIKLN